MDRTELSKYDYNNADGKIYVAIDGNIYDVSKANNFYGKGAYIINIYMETCSYPTCVRALMHSYPNVRPPYIGGNYMNLSGRDATRPLATMDMSNMEPVSRDELSPSEILKLDDWISKFKEKYEVIGKLKRE